MSARHVLGVVRARGPGIEHVVVATEDGFVRLESGRWAAELSEEDAELHLARLLRDAATNLRLERKLRAKQEPAP